MKAIELVEYNKLVYKDVDVPKPGPKEVLIKVHAVGICGSDIHGIDGSTGRRIPPVIMGHEATGTIAELGDGCTRFSIGDRVTFDSTLYCGECYFCTRGFLNLCDNRRVLGVSCDEYRQNGAFAEYVVVPERGVYDLPEGLSFEHGAMVEPVSIAVHGFSLAKKTIDDTAVVVGTGVIGLLLIQALKFSEIGKLIAVDIDPAKLEKARELGADITFNAKETEIPQAVWKETGGRGADVAFDVVGNTDSSRSAIYSLRKGGNVVIIGNFKPESQFPLVHVVSRQITVQGSCSSAGEYPACLDMMSRKIIDVEPLVSAVAPLSEGVEWLNRLYNQEPGLYKVILKP